MTRDEREYADRFTATLAGLAAALALALIGLYLAEELATVARREDCVMQGRLNCTRIELSHATAAR